MKNPEVAAPPTNPKIENNNTCASSLHNPPDLTDSADTRDKSPVKWLTEIPNRNMKSAFTAAARNANPQPPAKTQPGLA